jgi:hypothetical protein
VLREPILIPKLDPPSHPGRDSTLQMDHRMRMFYRIAALSFILSVPAAAQLSTGHASGGIGAAVGGASTGVGDFSNTAGTGWHAGITFALDVGPGPAHVRLEGLYHTFGSHAYAKPRLFALTDPNTPIPTGTSFHGDDKAIALLANIVWEFAAESSVPLRPYVLGGGGVYRVYTAEHCTGVCGNFYEGSVKFNKPGFNVGAGVNFDVGATGMYLEARLHVVPGASRLQGEAISARFVPISLGILFN